MANTKLNEEEIKGMFDKAHGLILNDQYPEAKKILLELINYFPTAFLLNYNLGLCYYMEESFDIAIDHYEKALADYPGNSDIIYNLALCYKKLNNLSLAITCFESILEIQKDDAELLYNLAGCYRENLQLEKAKVKYEESLAIEPDFHSAINNLAYTYHRLGEAENAKKAYERLLELRPDHPSAMHMLTTISQTSATSGHTPIEYVRELFDDFSEHFDKRLIENLDYQVPTKIGEEVQALAQEAGVRFSQTIDLGCGTGLAGQELRPYTDRMVGVDVAPKMIEKSRDKDIYDELFASNINDLDKTTKFNLIVAADVFAYIGDLEETFKQIKMLAAAESYLVFSVEKLSSKDDMHLESTGRYSHSLHYIKKLTEANDMDLLTSKETNIRKEAGKWLLGYICTIRVH